MGSPKSLAMSREASEAEPLTSGTRKASIISATVGARAGQKRFEGLVPLLLNRLKAPLDDRPEERLLRTKVIVSRAQVDGRSLRDRAHGRRRVAAVDEE